MRLLTILGTLTVMLTLLPSLASAEHVIDDSKNTSYLFVMSGTSGSLDRNTLTLNEVPNVIYFSDRPGRKVGHMTLTSFVEMWNKGSDSFKTDSPNATLSVLTKDGAENIVVKLVSVDQSSGSIKMPVVVLDGTVPQNFKAATLFIDAVGPGGVPPWEGG